MLFRSSPWSIRQTAVYHRRIPIIRSEHDSGSMLDAPGYRSVFLLISPSESFERQLTLCVDALATEKRAMSWQNIVRLLILDATKGWQEYMAWMEEEIREQVHGTLKLFLVVLPNAYRCELYIHITTIH